MAEANGEKTQVNPDQEHSGDGPAGAQRPIPSNQNTPLSPLAEPFDPRRRPPIITSTQHQFDYSHQLTDAILNPSNLSAYTRSCPPQNFQTLPQVGIPLTMYSQSGQNIERNEVRPENLSLHGVQRCPVFLPVNQFQVPNQYNLQYHPSGIQQFPNNLPQFDHNYFYSHEVTEGHKLPPGLFPGPVSHNKSQFFSQPRPILPNTQTVFPSSDHRGVSSDFPYVGVSPQNATPASSCSDQFLGWSDPHRLSQPLSVNTSLANSYSNTNYSLLSEWDSSSNLDPSNSMMLSGLLVQATNADRRSELAAPPLPRATGAIKKNIIKEYNDESDIAMCDFHFFNLYTWLPRRVVRGFGAPCFVCELNSKAGIYIPEAGEISGMRDDPEDALLSLTSSKHHSSVPGADSFMASEGYYPEEAIALSSEATSLWQYSEPLLSLASSTKKAQALPSVASSTKKAQALPSLASSTKEAQALPSVASSTKQAQALFSVASNTKQAQALPSVDSRSRQAQDLRSMASSTKQAQALNLVVSSTKQAQALHSVASNTKQAQALPSMASSIKQAQALQTVASSTKQAQALHSVVSSTKQAQALPSVESNTKQVQALSLVVSRTKQHSQVQALPSLGSSVKHSEASAIPSTRHHSEAGALSSTRHHSEAGALSSTRHHSEAGALSSTRHHSQDGAFSLMTSHGYQKNDSLTLPSAHQQSKPNSLSLKAFYGNEQQAHVSSLQFPAEYDHKKGNSKKNKFYEIVQNDQKLKTGTYDMWANPEYFKKVNDQGKINSSAESVTGLLKIRDKKNQKQPPETDEEDNARE